MRDSIYKHIRMSVVRKPVSNYVVMVEMLKSYDMVEATSLVADR